MTTISTLYWLGLTFEIVRSLKLVAFFLFCTGAQVRKASDQFDRNRLVLYWFGRGHRPFRVLGANTALINLIIVLNEEYFLVIALSYSFVKLCTNQLADNRHFDSGVYSGWAGWRFSIGLVGRIHLGQVLS